MPGSNETAAEHSRRVHPESDRYEGYRSQIASESAQRRDFEDRTGRDLGREARGGK